MDCDTCPRLECIIKEEEGPLDHCPFYDGEWRKILINQEDVIEEVI